MFNNNYKGGFSNYMSFFLVSKRKFIAWVKPNHTTSTVRTTVYAESNKLYPSLDEGFIFTKKMMRGSTY